MLSSYVCIPLIWFGLMLAAQDAPPTLGDAVLYGRENVVKTLVAAGANVNQPDDSGMTPLMIAASQGHVAIARMLIAAGADIGASSQDGTNALMRAASADRGEMVRLLNVSRCTSSIEATTPETMAVDMLVPERRRCGVADHPGAVTRLATSVL